MKKIISLLLALAIPLYALPLAAGAAGSDDNYYDLRVALNEAQDNGTIIIPSGKTGYVADLDSDPAAPWMIDKSVTIQGTDADTLLYIRSGGIILKADVTFKNVKISLANGTRNVIMANGHTLTLDNVTNETSTRDIHLACGGLVNSDQAVTPIGSHGQIIIKNCKSSTTFGNIYAGNISGGKSGDDYGNFPFEHPATVTIDPSSSCKTGTLYGCGALQAPTPTDWFGGEEPLPPQQSSTYYPVTGDVRFNLYYNTVSNVDGDTGGGKKAAVQYVCGQYSNSGLTLKNIASLTLAKNGNDTGALQPAAGSDLSGTNLSVPAGTTLNLASLTTPPTVNNFTGGGTLVLGKNQQLTINGTVGGETKVGIGGVSNDGVNSNTVITAGTTYIKTSASTNGTFKLLPYQTQPQMELKRDSNGNWVTYNPGTSAPETKVQSLTIPNQSITASTGATEVTIPFNAVLNNSSGHLHEIPLNVTLNGTSHTIKFEMYSWNLNGTDYYLDFDGDDPNFILMVTDNTAIPNGKYNFTVTIAAANTTDNKEISASFTVQVGDTENPTPPEPDKPTPIAVPVAKTGLKYTGEELTGVEAGTGYTLVGNTATEIGEYTATAALQNTTKYQWADGATDAKEIKWSIGKGAAPAAPTGLKATSPTKKDGRDGQISGTTDKMEYATNSDFSNVKDCTGDTITGLPAGTYYVRVKETDKFEAGDYAVVKVLAFGEVEEVPDPPVEVKIPVSGEEKTVEVVASIKDSTAVVSAIDTTQLGSVIGDKVNTGMVRIDFSGLEQEIDTVELPGAAIGEIAAAAQAQGNDVEGLSLKLSTGSVSFDAAALASIQKQAGSKVTLKILAKDRHDLTPEQLESIGTAPAFDLSLQGNAAITDFGTGKATVSLPYTLKPGQSAAGITVYYLDEKGKSSACPTRYSQVEKAATYTTSHFSLYFVGFDSAIQWKNPFNDVRKGDWFYGAVEFAELNGLMQGDSKTVFSPNQKLSRAQLAQILYNKEGRPWVRGSSFTDVPAKEWYANAVNWAAQKGYVMGYDSTHFGPNNSITREQLATILWRYAGEPKGKKNALSPFTDAGKASEYALPALRWAVQNEIIRGKGNNRLDPTGTATRAEVAQMLMNFLA